MSKSTLHLVADVCVYVKGNVGKVSRVFCLSSTRHSFDLVCYLKLGYNLDNPWHLWLCLYILVLNSFTF